MAGLVGMLRGGAEVRRFSLRTEGVGGYHKVTGESGHWDKEKTFKAATGYRNLAGEFYTVPREFSDLQCLMNILHTTVVILPV